MKYFLSLLALTLFLPLAAQADMIPDNTHFNQGCVRVDNAAAFPAYDFYLNMQTHGWPGALMLTATDYCPDKVDSSATAIFAVKKTDEPSLVKATDPDPNAEPIDWMVLPQNAKFIRSTPLGFALGAYIPNNDQSPSRHIVLHIDSVSDASIAAHIVDSESAPAAVAPTPAGANTKVAAEQAQAAQQSGPNSTAVTLAALAIVLVGVGGLVYLATAWKK